MAERVKSTYDRLMDRRTRTIKPVELPPPQRGEKPQAIKRKKKPNG